ncbi:hypothetical protein SAMN05216573_10192 [Bradyrhizobium sp. Rc3b]|uniref:hypothetical protein n=1 Tax=Bradyrhizobium sp. Rc3b TaxID=1855322 RepID=UPI0008E44511|nr:hypothetical protein [Bradyrhizobium sp. Rc3b]SFM34668.1 hypothetical protein SAMN05216573_10192 [Bradyrhizobium sp. Rc3b]
MNWSAFFPVPAFINGARSTVLQTLSWMMVLLITALVASGIAHVSEWLLVLLAVLLSINFLVFILAYLYFAKTNPEFLRSEQFAIRKLEIEHRLVGDDTTGPMEDIVDGEVIEEPRRLGRPPQLISAKPAASKRSKPRGTK